MEFGAKLIVSLTGEGLACIDHLRWDAFMKGVFWNLRLKPTVNAMGSNRNPHWEILSMVRETVGDISNNEESISPASRWDVRRKSHWRTGMS